MLKNYSACKGRCTTKCGLEYIINYTLTEAICSKKSLFSCNYYRKLEKSDVLGILEEFHCCYFALLTKFRQEKGIKLTNNKESACFLRPLFKKTTCKSSWLCILDKTLNSSHDHHACNYHPSDHKMNLNPDSAQYLGGSCSKFAK